MADYTLHPPHQLPALLQAVWDDIWNTDFKPEQAKAVMSNSGLLDFDPERVTLPRIKRDLAPFTHRLIGSVDVSTGVLSDFKRLAEADTKGWAIWQPNARHTGEQAIWTIEQVQERGLDSVAIYAPRFHVPRAALTLAKAAFNAGWVGKIYPFGWLSEPGPLRLAGADNTPTEAELVPGEQLRIESYIHKGDVATPGIWQRYRPAA